MLNSVSKLRFPHRLVNAAVKHTALIRGAEKYQFSSIFECCLLSAHSIKTISQNTLHNKIRVQAWITWVLAVTYELVEDRKMVHSLQRMSVKHT